MTIKRVATVIMIAFALSAIVPNVGQAKGVEIKSDECITEFKSNSVLIYKGDGVWSVEDNGGDESNYEEVDLDVLKYEFNDENGPCYSQILPKPVAGMKVYYDNWGEIENIEVKAGIKNGLYNQFPIVFKGAKYVKEGSRAANGTYKYGTVVDETKSKVGYTKNKIVITSSKVTGTGDLTCFCDKIGNHDNTLKKGDCATKYKYDNPSSGTPIKVTNMLNGKSAVFTKNDIGGMPNAVIDIWKTGVSLLGITSTNYDDIKQAAKYTYSY